jgi:peptidoglycan hydrolase CwlO-like protein
MRNKTLIAIIMVFIIVVCFLFSNFVYNRVYDNMQQKENKINSRIEEIEKWQNEVEKNGIGIK